MNEENQPRITQDEQQQHAHLLAQHGSREGSPEHDASPQPYSSDPSPLTAQRRVSSFAQPRPNGAPRTPNRVRFEESDLQHRGEDDDQEEDDTWLDLDEEDYFHNRGPSNRWQRAPLLTGIEAPSVTVATEDFDPEDLLESARPKSGMGSAFMNMANSIM